MSLPFFFSDLLSKNLISYKTDAQLLCYLLYGLTLFSVAGAGVFLTRQPSAASVAALPLAKTASTIAVVLLVCAYLLLIAAIVTQMQPLFYAAALAGSFGLAGCYAKWFSLLCRAPVRVATVSLLLSYASGSFLRLIISYVAPLAALAFAAVLVVAGQVFWWVVSAKMGGGGGRGLYCRCEIFSRAGVCGP
jgi:hypothetical protein